MEELYPDHLDPSNGADESLRDQVRNRAERVPLRALEKRGFRSVRVLDMRTIERIVSEAVDNALSRHSGILPAGKRKQVEEEAKREFLELLEAHKRLTAQKGEVDRRKDELEQQVMDLRGELQSQQRALDDARGRAIGIHELTFNADSFSEMELKIRELFRGLMTTERRMSLAEAGPGALKGLSELERELVSMIDRIMADLRERYVDRERAEQEKNIDLLERRISKLSKTLADTEDALKKVAASKQIDPGVASMFECIQGLGLDDSAFARKSELLKEVFLQNLALQNKEVKPEDRDHFPARTHGADVPAAPAGFEPPVETEFTETAF